MGNKFIISTDSCVDHFKSYLDKNGVYCITMKRIVKDKEIIEHYNSPKEFDKFYDDLKKGAMPTTTQLNPFELEEYFKSILELEKDGDIIHVALSSELSKTFANAQKVAEDMNKTLVGRKIHVIDSLIATHGMAMLVDELIEMRNKGTSTADAIKRTEQLRDHQQGWVIMSDLQHLRRGGRIGGFQATVGALLGIKPIVVITKAGKLQIENKMKGDKNAIKYILEKIETLGVGGNQNFMNGPLYLVRTSESKTYGELKNAISQKYPTLKIKEGIVGPVIGTHLGCDGVVVVFEGAKRLDIE